MQWSNTTNLIVNKTTLRQNDHYWSFIMAESQGFLEIIYEELFHGLSILKSSA